MRTGGPKDDGPKLIGEKSQAQVEETDVLVAEETVEAVEETKAETDRYETKQKSTRDQATQKALRQAPRPTGRTPHGGATLITQTLTRTGKLLAKLEEEAEAVLRLLGDSDLSPESVKRHAKKLDRIREQLQDGSRRRNAQERALWEAQTGLTELEESKLSLADERLAQALEAGVTGLLALVAELGNGRDTRRLVVRRCDRQSALGYASSTNPTTLFLDTPFMTLGHFEPTETQSDDLGRTLLGQRRLELATTG